MRSGLYGRNHDAGIWPVVPINIIPASDTYDGSPRVTVVCIVQAGDAGFGDYAEGWQARAEDLFTYEGDNLLDAFPDIEWW